MWHVTVTQPPLSPMASCDKRGLSASSSKSPTGPLDCETPAASVQWWPRGGGCTFAHTAAGHGNDFGTFDIKASAPAPPVIPRLHADTSPMPLGRALRCGVILWLRPLDAAVDPNRGDGGDVYECRHFIEMLRLFLLNLRRLCLFWNDEEGAQKHCPISVVTLARMEVSAACGRWPTNLKVSAEECDFIYRRRFLPRRQETK